MIRPDSIILSFGRERSGDNAGSLAAHIAREKLNALNEQELRGLQQLVRTVFEMLVQEDQFRRVKEAKAFVDNTPVVIP